MGQKNADLLQERLVTFENKHESQRRTNEVTSKNPESKETRGKDCLRYRDHILKLQREVRNLRKKVLRAPGQRYHAVRVAVTKTASKLGGHSNVWKIKHPNEQIKDWVRDLACWLITIHHIPATQAPGVVSVGIEVVVGGRREGMVEASTCPEEEGEVVGIRGWLTVRGSSMAIRRRML